MHPTRASRPSVAGLVLRQAAIVLTAGLVFGTAGAWMLTGLIQKLLFETPAHDGVSFGAATAAIAVAATCATVVPLIRATNVDASSVLRGD